MSKSEKASLIEDAAIRDRIQELKGHGIRLSIAIFGRPVRSNEAASVGTPENAMFDISDKTAKVGKRGKLWYTPIGVLIEQNGRHSLIPLSNVLDTKLL